MSKKPMEIAEEESFADAAEFLLPLRPHRVGPEAESSVEDNLPDCDSAVAPLGSLEGKTPSALSELREHLNRAANIARQHPQLANSVCENFQDLSTALSEALLPPAPLWSQPQTRAGRNPAAFIKDEYFGGKEPDDSITRRMIGAKDPLLAAAYATHIKRYPDDALWDSDRTSKRRNLKKMTPKAALEHKRELDRDRQSRARTKRAPLSQSRY